MTNNTLAERWSAVAMIPLAGSAIKANAKTGRKVVSAVGNLAPVVKAKDKITSLKLTYKVSEKGTELLEYIKKVFDDN